MGKIIIRGLAAGVAMFIMMMLIGFVCQALFPGLEEQYKNTLLYRDMEGDWRSQLFWAFPLLQGFILSWLWSKVSGGFAPGQSKVSRGFGLGLMYFIISTIPGMYATYASFQVSKEAVITWMISALVSAVVGGIVIALLDRDTPTEKV